MERHVKARSFVDLVVWQKAHQFVLGSYTLTGSFPKSETFGLTAQFRRAAISIAANIAEGFRKRGKPDKVRLMNVAQASIEECKYHLILCRDLGYADPTLLQEQLEEVSRLLEGYTAAILADHSSIRPPRFADSSSLLTSDF